LIINSQGVAKQLSELNLSKACGKSHAARILKELSPSISHWLCFIFQQSYDSGTLPPDWSKALVSAVFKKDLKSNPARVCVAKSWNISFLAMFQSTQHIMIF
jgi:hypothetical protein